MTEVRILNKTVKKEKFDIKRVIEALLFAAPEPLSLVRLETLTEGMDRGGKSLSQTLNELSQDYEEEGKSFAIVKVAQGYQLKTRDEYAPWVKKLFQPRRYLRLSRPALETLAIIAYQQPVTRVEIEAIRGVNVEGILKNLLERELVKISGQKEVVGRPYLYRTNRRFLEHFGLNSLSDLPPLEPGETPKARKTRESGNPEDLFPSASSNIATKGNKR